ncbi:MAG: hypothetical protein QW244_01000 [Candidatus Pacearchaeota archaeon]
MPELLDVIKELKRYGYSDDQIIAYLQQQGFNPKEILDAINKAKVPKEVVEEERAPSIMEMEAPAPAAQPAPTAEISAGPPTAAAPEVIPSVPFAAEAPTTAMAQYPAIDIETIETMAEEIINEKWEMLKRRVGDIEDLKKQVEVRISNIEERIKKVELNLDKIYLLILKRQEEQVKEIAAVGKEVDMLSEAFSKILTPLTENIKKLEEIRKSLSKKK